MAGLLDHFFAYVAPNFEEFEEAGEEFKQHVLDLASGEKIKKAHRGNRPFVAAFDASFHLGHTALTPDIRAEAVDEMLIRHLLTERCGHLLHFGGDHLRLHKLGLVKDGAAGGRAAFWAVSRVGKELADLHVIYETLELTRCNTWKTALCRFRSRSARRMRTEESKCPKATFKRVDAP